MAKNRSEPAEPVKPAPVPAVPDVPDDDAEWLPLDASSSEFKVLASFDTSTEEGTFKLSYVLNANAAKKEMWPERKFICRDVVLHKVASPNRQTGKIEVRTRTVLIGPGNELAQFQSKGVIGSLRTLFAQFGRPPWVPALILQWDTTPATIGNVAKLYAIGRLDK